MLTMLLACSIDPAPEDLDGLAHWTWVHHDDASQQDLEAAADSLRGFDDSDGLITDIVAAEVEHIGLDGAELDQTRGWYVLNRFDCDLELLQQVLAHKDQDDWREYESYDRQYTSDLDAFHSGESETMTWDTDYSAKYLTATFTCHATGGLRRVGDVLLARTWFRSPCESDNEDYDWQQDFQNEVFLPDGEGRILHLYNMWREIEAAGLTEQDDGLVNLMQGGMRDFDDTTAEACASW